MNRDREGERRMSSATPATPADVLARRRQLMLDGDADGLADLFAPDAVIEFTFHGPPGTPVRLEGREVIREYSRQVMMSSLRLEEYEVTGLYQARDPDGQIVLFRDFADPRILEQVSGELPPES